MLGQNGSGKSTLLKCFAGIQPWTSGDILRRGISRQDDVKDFNSKMILVSEDIMLPNFLISDLAQIYEEIWLEFDSSLFQKILGFADISDKRRPNQLSRGQKALVQLGLALAAGVETMLIDEVTAVLDPYVRNRIVGEIMSYNRRKSATVVIATNIATEFTGFDTEMILLEKGHIFLSGKFSELQKEFTKLTSPTGSGFVVPPGFIEISGPSDTGIICVGRRLDFIGKTIAEEMIVTLEDMFIYLSGRRGQ